MKTGSVPTQNTHPEPWDRSPPTIHKPQGRLPGELGVDTDYHSYEFIGLNHANNICMKTRQGNQKLSLSARGQALQGPSVVTRCSILIVRKGQLGKPILSSGGQQGFHTGVLPKSVNVHSPKPIQTCPFSAKHAAGQSIPVQPTFERPKSTMQIQCSAGQYRPKMTQEKTIKNTSPLALLKPCLQTGPENDQMHTKSH